MRYPDPPLTEVPIEQEEEFPDDRLPVDDGQVSSSDHA